MLMTPKQFVLWFLRCFAVLLVVLTAFQLWLDPFWAWRRNPPWVAWHHGHNWNLDIRMRSAKALQLLTRHPTTILLGSSRTYHGFDVSGMKDTYNLGISGLRMRELEAYARYAILHTEVKHLVIGLDYFMFDARHPTEPGFNPALTHPRYLFDAIPAALYSADALSGARYALKGHKAREGVWDYYGHKALFPIGAEKIPEILKAERENLSLVEPDAEAYRALSRVLAFAKQQHVQVTLYLSPTHPVQRVILRKEHALDRFLDWRARVTAISNENAISLYDFTGLQFGDEADLLTQGTTAHWQDPTHFTPLSGAWLLQEMEVR